MHVCTHTYIHTYIMYLYVMCTCTHVPYRYIPGTCRALSDFDGDFSRDFGTEDSPADY